MDLLELRILVVENNPVDVLAIRNELEQVQDDARFVMTVVQSIAELRHMAHKDEFDMVLLDLGLDDSEGLETLRTVRQLLPLLPIVVMSGLEDDALALQAVRESAQDYIFKDSWNRRLLVRALLHAFEREKRSSGKHHAQMTNVDIESHYRSVFEYTHDIVCIKDLSRGITHVNPAMAELFRRSASEFRGTMEEDWYEAEVSDQIKRWDLRALNGETLEEEHRRTVEGYPLTFLEMRMPLRDERKEIIGVCCLSRNVTERMRAVSDEPAAAIDCPSSAMRAVMEAAREAAESDGPVLLRGEIGSGKDYLARWIHHRSSRRRGPYFALNCASLPADLAESELFGNEADAAAGRPWRKKGVLELAEGGSLLLNEIGRLPLGVQSKLLTFLETKSFRRVQGETNLTVDARIMVASHRDLQEELSDGPFLEPLYARLAVFSLEVPPLRDRPADIPVLAEHIMAALARRMNRPHIPELNDGVLNELKAYAWPGNVRELENILERALILWDGGRFDLHIPTTRSPQPASL